MKLKSSLITKTWQLMKPFHRTLYAIFFVTVLFETIRMGGPYLFGRILDVLIKSNGKLSFQTAVVIVGGLAGVRFVSLVIDYITDVIIELMLLRAHRHVSTTAFSKLLELSIDYHERVNTGTKINMVNKGADKLIELVGSYTFELQPLVLQLIVSSVFIGLTSWKIGIVFSLSLIPFIFITYKLFEATKHLRSERHDAYEFSSGEIGDTITNISVVKAFAQESREDRSFQSIWSNIKDLSIREYKAHMIVGFGRSLTVEIFYIVLLVLGMVEIGNGALTVGSLVFLINMIERAYSNIYRIGRIYNRAADAAEPVERISNLLAQKSSIKLAEAPIFPDEIHGEIGFKNVNFAYNKRKVLSNLSFTIPSGSFTAIVGKSGSGKSTIAKLISRYYDPTSGGIFIDGQYDLRDLDLDKFRATTSVVFQDSPVPSRTVWEVISYAAGKQNYEDVKESVIVAAKLAYAHDFILELDEGYQTKVGERGVKLSGGQRQRLAIARALFSRPKILIMDEPTSHLDTLSESLIQKALEDLSASHSMTKVIIAHRLSTVQKADQILVMDRGRLLESGTHRELLAKDGVYAEIVKQSELKG